MLLSLLSREAELELVGTNIIQVENHMEPSIRPMQPTLKWLTPTSNTPTTNFPAIKLSSMIPMLIMYVYKLFFAPGFKRNFFVYVD